MEVGGTRAEEGSQPLQQTQTSDGKPAAELSTRREPQSLPPPSWPPLEAPGPVAPEVKPDAGGQAAAGGDPARPQCLWQDEDPDPSWTPPSQAANVHFVVQHGCDPKEMLEQAIAAAAGHAGRAGIQLGQTVVQQQAQRQSQQQSQGQSAFTGQEQQGQQGSGSFAVTARGGEHAARTLSLLVESTNDTGIDFLCLMPA